MRQFAADMSATETLSPAVTAARDTSATRPSLVVKPQAAPHAAQRPGDTTPASVSNPATPTTPVTAAPAAAATFQADPAVPAADGAAARVSAGAPGQRRSASDIAASTPAVVAGPDSPSSRPPAVQDQAVVSAPLSAAALQPVAPQAAAAPLVPASASAEIAVPTSSAPLAASPPTAPPTPAQQALNPLVSLGSSQGTHHVTVRLDPVELGRLQIRIEQPSDGPARVMLTAERSQTLDLLVRDQAQLHRALDQAGVPADGRSITFHLATPTPDPSADPSRTSLASASTGSTAGDLASGGGRGGAQQGPPRDGFSSGPPSMAGGEAVTRDATPGAARWLRTGIDITA